MMTSLHEILGRLSSFLVCGLSQEILSSAVRQLYATISVREPLTATDQIVFGSKTSNFNLQDS